MQGGPQLLQGPFFDAGYIAPGDPKRGGDLPLGQRHSAAQAVAQTDDLCLPAGQTLPQQGVEPQGVVTVVEIFQHGVIYAYHVDQLQGVALLVVLDGVRQGDLPLEFFLDG